MHEGTTFGGNPFASRVAHYCFDRLSSPSLLANVTAMSQILERRLSDFVNKFPNLVSEVRGRGLILGLGLKEDPTPIVDACRTHGLLVISAGNNTIRFVPPLVIDEKTLAEGLNILDIALESRCS